MTFLNRLRLRDNWPLWMAGAGFLLILSYLLYSQKIPQHPYYYTEFSTSAIIYPLLILVNSLEVLLGFTLVAFVVLLVVGVETFKRRTIRSAVIFGVFICFPMFACMAVYSLVFDGANFAHKESHKFNEHIYHLGEVTLDRWDLGSGYFVVYECDQIGILCSPTYSSDSYSLDNSYVWDYDETLHSNTTLITDPANNQLYLQIGNEHFLVTPRS
jgi:hypothetical protein